MLVFDISRRNTFASVTAWLHDLRQIAEDDIVVVLVGNKSDLAASSTVSGDQSAANKRQVTREEAEEWCRENKVMQYVETSAKSGENVERAFLEVAERIYQVRVLYFEGWKCMLTSLNRILKQVNTT